VKATLRAATRGGTGSPLTATIASAMASGGGLMAAFIYDWPPWALVLATMLPWVPLVAVEVRATYRAYPGLALFYVLVSTQGGHFLEHVVQMLQIHALGLKGPAARGVFGALDIEWVHFLWNSWVLVAVLLLLTQFRRNPWLWLTAVLAAWHEVEHGYIMLTFLSTGVAGTAGLLARGGALRGGLPLLRPDLHFLYNLIETVPLFAAFLWQARRAVGRPSQAPSEHRPAREPAGSSTAR
jgi:hypothetical protein